MESAANIMNYTGNANLGIGAGNDVPVSGGGDFANINRAGEQLRMFDHENQLKIFDQKVKDRDALLKMLMDEQTQVGDILPEDRKYYDEAEKRTNESYSAIKDMNDREGIAKNQNEAKNLKGIAAWAQSKKVEIAKLKTEQAKLTIPSEIEAMQKHIDKQIAKKPGEVVEPYQQAFSYDDAKLTQSVLTGSVLTGNALTTGLGTKGPETQTTKKVTDANGKVTTVTTDSPVGNGKVKGTPKTAGVNGVNGIYDYTPDKHYDLPTIQKNTETLYVNDPNATQGMIKALENFNTAPLEVQKQTLKSYQERLFDYYHERGIEPDQTGQYPDDIKYTVLEPVKDAKGKIVDYRPKYVTVDDKGNAIFGQQPSSRGVPANVNQATGEDKVMLNETAPSYFAKKALASINDNYVQKGQAVFNKDKAEFGIKAQESKAKIGAINALAAQRRAAAALSHKKGQALDQQWNPAQTFDEIFKGKMKTSEGNTLPYVNISDMPKAFIDNIGIDPATDDGDYKLVPVNVKRNGKSIPEEEVQALYSKWLSTSAAKELGSKIGKSTPDIFDFLFAYGADFSPPEIIGRVRPIYSKTKLGTDGKPLLLNPNEVGKQIRSNRLQSWINQRKEMDVKGSKLLMEQDAAEQNDNTDNQ